MSNYGSPQLEFKHAAGCYTTAINGDRYLDFAMGIGVNSLGHCHPVLVKALQDQAGKIWHCSNLYRIGESEKLAKKLVQISFADKVFFSNSGTEAVECGFKMMRRYHHDRGNPKRKRIIALSESFHGRTLAPIAAAANPLHCEGFLSGDPGFENAPFGDLDALKKLISEETAGIILEPVQGEGGIRVIATDYLQAIRDLCDEQGLLLMFDEVQCGVGRTGYFYAHESSGVNPDILASAKGLGGGFPVGACLATQEVAKVMVAGIHGSTFGGNPLAMAVGNAVLDVITEAGFLQRSREHASYLREKLERIIRQHPGVLKEQTGIGLMVGIKCVASNTDLISALQQAKLLSIKAGANSIRLLPPLNVSKEEIDEACDILETVVARL